jgi:hypothetical protein
LWTDTIGSDVYLVREHFSMRSIDVHIYGKVSKYIYFKNIILFTKMPRRRHRRWCAYECSVWFSEKLGKCNDNQKLILLFALTYLLSWCWFGDHVVFGCRVVRRPAFYHLVPAIVTAFFKIYIVPVIMLIVIFWIII